MAMVAPQKRWFCHSCKREWVYCRLWEEGSACPYCGGETELIKFQPEFLGGDIPRSGAMMNPPATISVEGIQPVILKMLERTPQ